jgi:hypothetical protein
LSRLILTKLSGILTVVDICGLAFVARALVVAGARSGSLLSFSVMHFSSLRGKEELRRGESGSGAECCDELIQLSEFKLYHQSPQSSAVQPEMLPS